MAFLKATRGEDWKTLEALVADLDRAGYWKNEPELSPAEKRRHVRKMLATLVFREAGPPPEAGGGPSLVGRHVFVSSMRHGSSDEPVRVYKQVFYLTAGELQNMIEDGEAGPTYRTRRATQDREMAEAYLGGDEEDDALLLEELTEATMRRAWPGTSPAERSRIVLAALVQQRHWEEALRTVSEQCRAEGFDTEKLLDEYLHAAGVSPVVDAQEANEIARSAAEYFKVVDQLEGFNLGKMCLEALMEARTRAVEEFAEREVIDFKEAAALLGGKLGEYADEFQAVLETYRRDVFGWTLDEHLQFAVERREEQARRETEG